MGLSSCVCVGSDLNQGSHGITVAWCANVLVVINHSSRDRCSAVRPQQNQSNQFENGVALTNLQWWSRVICFSPSRFGWTAHCRLANHHWNSYYCRLLALSHVCLVVMHSSQRCPLVLSWPPAWGYNHSKLVVSMSTEKLQWKDLSLDEIELVLQTEEVTGEPEDYEYIRQDGKLRVFSGDSIVDVDINEMKTAWSLMSILTRRLNVVTSSFADAWFKI